MPLLRPITFYVYYSKELKGHCLISCSSQSWGHGRNAVRNAAINAQRLAPIVELYSRKIGLSCAMQFLLWIALLCHPEASEIGSFSVKIAFLFGLSVPNFKIKILISCQNQVELDVILQYQFVRGQKICMFDTPMQFSELHQTRHWPLKYFE